MEAQDFINWEQMWGQFARNVQADKLARFCQALGVSHEAAQWLGIGWDGSKKAWITREFDHEGRIVGLSCRGSDMDGTPRKKKWTITGSKRGLIYAPDPEFGGIPSYIDHPIPVPEGATDVLACLTVGIYSIGRPSASGTADSNAWLQKAVRGRDIALCMEYDKGAGMVSVLDHAKRLIKPARSIRFLEPVEGAKDMREWIQFPHAVDEIQFQFNRPPFEASSLSLVAGDILTQTAPMDVAKAFVMETQTAAGRVTLRRWADRWMYWDGHAYRTVTDEKVRAGAYQYLDGKLVLEPPKSKDPEAEWKEKPYRPDRTKVSNVLDAVKSLPDVYLDDHIEMPCWLESGEDLPDLRDMIAFKNGILDVATFAKTGQVKWVPKTPLLFTSNYCPYNFKPDAVKQAKPFVEWLTSALECEDTVQLIRQWLGYCMTNNNQHEKFMFMYGRPSAGKGTCMDVMNEVIGPRNVYSMRLDSLGDGFGLYSALGTTNIFMPDTQATNFERSNVALEYLKTITGNAPVDVAGKNIQARSIHMIHRFTIASNTLPNFHDSASALRRRLLVAWFPNVYEHKMDPTLKARLVQPRVIEGVAVWAVRGYVDLLRTGKFTIPASSRQIVEDFETANNPLASFFKDNCVFENDYRMPKDTMYESYKLWCKSNGYRPMKATQFKMHFPMQDPRITTAKSSPGQFSPGRRDQIYVGVRLKGPLDD